MIFLCLAGLLFGLLRLPFGPVEALGVSIFIGLAANYSLHVVHAYHHSDATLTDASDMETDEGAATRRLRSRKVRDSIFVTGSPITASALSTIEGLRFGKRSTCSRASSRLSFGNGGGAGDPRAGCFIFFGRLLRRRLGLAGGLPSSSLSI